MREVVDNLAFSVIVVLESLYSPFSFNKFLLFSIILIGSLLLFLLGSRPNYNTVCDKIIFIEMSGNKPNKYELEKLEKKKDKSEIISHLLFSICIVSGLFSFYYGIITFIHLLLN